MRKLTICDIIISAITLAVVSAALVPAIAVMQRSPQDAKCQSNMARWAEAMQLYIEDNDGSYPVNRLLPNHMLTYSVRLSPREFDENGDPIRFAYGINWVEALYPYVIKSAKATGRDWETLMKCPNTGDLKYPSTSQTARMTYVFNYCLLEQPYVVVRDGAKLMMMREMDRLMESVCRPVNDSTGNIATPPQSPFLTPRDYIMRSSLLNHKLHGQGSYIVFADGHVKYFSEEYFPNYNTIYTALVAADSWDPETQQWWNWVNKGPALDKAIAVTP